MNRDRRESSKPFVWLYLPKRVDRCTPPGHDRCNGHYTGTLECELTLLTPIHIGSGLFRLVDGQVVKEFVRQGGEILIPGSSLKGAFRSVAEAISHSCVSKTNHRVPSKFTECRDPEKLCVCCRLFGGLGYLGRVRFKDAHPIDSSEPSIFKIHPLWPPNQTRLGRKFYKHGRPSEGNEPIEVLPKGTRFKFEVEVESLSKEEMCLLLTAMGILEDLKLKVGGAKPRCLGSVQVSLLRAHFWDTYESGTSYQRRGNILSPSELIQQVKNSDGLIDKGKLSRLRLLLGHPEKGECPPRLY